jgi:hypothetical protein
MSIPSNPDQLQVKKRENKKPGFTVTIFFAGVLGTMLITSLLLTNDDIFLFRNNLTPQKQDLLNLELLPTWIVWLYYS